MIAASEGRMRRVLRCGGAVALAAWLSLAGVTNAQDAPGSGSPAELRRLLEGGRYGDAEREARGALVALARDGNGESATTAEVLDLLVAALWRGGKASEAEAVAFAERAIAIKESLFGPANPAVALSLDNAGVLFFVRGDYERAGPLYERARTIWTNASASTPNRSAALAAVHSHLGPLFQELGQYSTAREHYEHALALLRETLGPENTQVAMTENNLATLLARIGDYGEAQNLYRASLAVLERQLGSEHPLIGNSKHNLGDLDQRMRLDDEAVELYTQAAALKEKVLGPAHPSLAITLSNLSYLYSDRAEFEEAESLAARALEINERAYGPVHVDLAYSLISLGRAQAGRGDLATARATLERALSLRIAVLGQDNPLLVPPLHFLSQTLLGAGTPREAFAHALRAETIARNHLRLTARGAPERQALRYSAERLSSLDLALAIAAEDASLAAAGWDGLIRSRAVVLDEMAVRNRLATRGADPSSAAALAAYRTAAERLVNVLVRGPGSGNVDAYRRQVAELRAVEEAAERSVAAASETLRGDLAEREVGYEEVRASVPAGAVLVAFARIGGGRYTGVAEATYVAFVYDAATQSLRARSLGSARAIEVAVRRWRDELGTDPSMPDAAGHRRAGERLRELLWDPLGIESGGDALVLMVPAGAIHLVNFSALPLQDGKFLAEIDLLIHYLASERDLLPRNERVASPELLAVGGAEFGGRREPDSAGTAAISASINCDLTSQLEVPPLPGALREARRVASMWTAAAGRRASVAELTSGAATKAAFQHQAAGKTVIHVATHGFFVANDCLSDAADSPSPLRMSGLVFADAGDDVGDSILLAEEVAAMDLRDAQWVVLSGCDTGLGQIEVDEGILGLRRAFRVAGAATLVMSLWPVEDRSTEAFMAGLYEARLGGGQSSVSAMRAGYRAALASARNQHGDHPRYWAPFIASGDWR